jgi:gliding motility-associated-like protein
MPYTASFINSSTNASSYWWSFGDPLSGINNTSTLSAPVHIYNTPNTFLVTLVAIDTFTCNKYDTIQFTVLVDTNAVIASFTANPITGCYPLNVSVNNLSWHALSYQWSFGDGTFSTSSNPPSHLYTDTLHYLIQLIASDSTSCNKHDTSSILVDPYYTEVIAGFIPSDTLQCGILDLSLTNVSQNALSYIWDLGDATTSTLFQPNHTYYTPGNYLVTLIAQNPNLCKTSDTSSHWLHVFQQPIALFTTIPFTWKPDSLFQFPNASQYADHYQWFVDGVLYSTAQDASAAFHKLGYHTICLMASTNAGCSDTLCRQVYVDVIPSIGVPNAFSPDGDGINDFLNVYGLGIETIDFKIYNRWGQLVFETNDRNQGWDGTFKGVPQEMDAYAWTLNATFITGTSKTLKGNVTLVR